MSEIIAIDFLLGTDWQSSLISWWGQGPGGWSHCASVLKDGRYLDARNDVLNKVPGGIHIREPATEKWKKKRRCTLEVTKPEYDDWEANLRAKIGDAYAQNDIVGFFLDRMMHQPGTYDCSALVINALQHIKRVPFPLPIPAHQITPNAALLIVATAGFHIGEVQLPVIPSASAPSTT
jgi:hypothetical protein